MGLGGVLSLGLKKNVPFTDGTGFHLQREGPIYKWELYARGNIIILTTSRWGFAAQAFNSC